MNAIRRAKLLLRVQHGDVVEWQAAHAATLLSSLIWFPAMCSPDQNRLDTSVCFTLPHRFHFTSAVNPLIHTSRSALVSTRRCTWIFYLPASGIYHFMCKVYSTSQIKDKRFMFGWVSPAQFTTHGVSIVPCGVSTAFTFFTPRSSVRTWMPVTGQFSITWCGEDVVVLSTCNVEGVDQQYLYKVTNFASYEGIKTATSIHSLQALSSCSVYIPSLLTAKPDINSYMSWSQPASRVYIRF